MIGCANAISELSILNAIAKELNAQLRLDRALHVALFQVAQLLDLQAGWVWLLREENGESLFGSYARPAAGAGK